MSDLAKRTTLGMKGKIKEEDVCLMKEAELCDLVLKTVDIEPFFADLAI